MHGEVTTAIVKVRVTGDCNLKDVRLVINGDDLEIRWVPLESDGMCRWTVNLGDERISTSTASFSLRADMKRSGCKKAEADVTDETKPFANLVFTCCKGPFRKVNVKVVPPMRVNYVRDVHPFAEDRNPIRCLEFATLDDGEGSISNARFKDEEIFFDFGRFNPKRQELGLRLNPIMVDDSPLRLTLDGVVFRLTVQRVKAQVRSAPTLSPNAMSLDIKKLVNLKFERAEFQVVK